MSQNSFFCPHCCRDTVFQFQAVYEFKPKTDTGEAIFFASFWKCGHCFHPITAISSQLSNLSTAVFDHIQTGGNVFRFSETEVLRTYPTADHLNPPKHTPTEVAKPYRQGCINFVQGHFEPCVAMLRKTLELTIKTINPQATGLLASKIKQTFKANLITPAMYEWAQTIKLFGNEAIHDPVDIPENIAADILAFTEVLLLYVFTLPEMIKLRPRKSNAPYTHNP